MSEQNKVHIQKCTDLKRDVQAAMDAIQWETIVPQGARVAIKVNLCDVAPKKGVTTTPELVYEVIGILKSRRCEVFVVESDNLAFSARAAYQGTKLEEAVEKAGAQFVNLTTDDKVTIYPEKTLFVREYAMPRTLQEADVLVTMPLLKTHDITLYTGALKNQFGCYSQRNRVLLHPSLDEAIVDIDTILEPQIVIMDALTAIEGNGPARGYPIKMDLIITSNNVVSCDLVALQIMEFDVSEVGHVLLARNLHPEAEDYVLSGEPIESIRRPFKPPYDDLANRAQKFIFKHQLLIKIFFTSRINQPIFKLAKIYRRWALRGKTEYF